MIDCLEFRPWSEETRQHLEGLAASAARRRQGKAGFDVARLSELLRRVVAPDVARRPSREEIEAVLKRT
jgi:hypothetical protein